MGLLREALSVVWSREKVLTRGIDDNKELNIDNCVCFMTPYDRVKYMIPGIEKPLSMPVEKFIKWAIDSFKIQDWQQFRKWIMQYQTVYIDKTGDVQIIHGDVKEASFSKMVDINKAILNKDDEKKGNNLLMGLRNSIGETYGRITKPVRHR